MSKEEIIKAIQACAKELGRNPKQRELEIMTGITDKILWRRFGSLSKALEASGLEARGRGFPAEEAALLLDWGAVVRMLGKMPSVNEYRRGGRFSDTPFLNRYGRWSDVGRAFRKFVEGQGSKSRRQWRDVLAMISPHFTQKARGIGAPVIGEERIAPKNGADRGTGPRQLRPKLRRLGGVYLDRPTYGAPLLLPEMAHAPTNELGVMFLFGALARKLGFVVHRIRGKYPDCIAVRETAPGVWQRVRIEFEYESRNFQKHRHRKDGCDVIVCWKHNWKECPEWIEVVELGKYCGR